MIAWCARCGRPADYMATSWYELGRLLLVRAWCHGEAATAQLAVELLDSVPQRFEMFPADSSRPAGCDVTKFV